MTALDVAAELGVNERTVRRAIADGRLPAVKRGGVYDIDLELARAVITARTGPASAYRAALADALQLLRAFGYKADAEEFERRHGLRYVAPQPQVFAERAAA